MKFTIKGQSSFGPENFGYFVLEVDRFYHEFFGEYFGDFGGLILVQVFFSFLGGREGCFI